MRVTFADGRRAEMVIPGEHETVDVDTTLMLIDPESRHLGGSLVAAGPDGSYLKTFCGPSFGGPCRLGERRPVGEGVVYERYERDDPTAPLLLVSFGPWAMTVFEPSQLASFALWTDEEGFPRASVRQAGAFIKATGFGIRAAGARYTVASSTRTDCPVDGVGPPHCDRGVVAYGSRISLRALN